MTFELLRGNITAVAVDAVVNAANSSLLGGGGGDEAIHRAGGPEILDACRAYRARRGPLATGGAIVTTAGRLPAKHVIHAVGPIWRGGYAGERGQLAATYLSALKCAADVGAASVAFPPISTGAYGFPAEEAAEIAVRTLRAAGGRFEAVERGVFVCGDEETYGVYEGVLKGGGA